MELEADTDAVRAGEVGELLQAAHDAGPLRGGGVRRVGAAGPDPDPRGAEFPCGGEHGLALGADLLVGPLEAQVGAVGGDRQPRLLGELARPTGRGEIAGRDVHVPGPLDALEPRLRGQAHDGGDLEGAEGHRAQAGSDHRALLLGACAQGQS